MPSNSSTVRVTPSVPTAHSMLECLSQPRLLDLARLFGFEIHESKIAKERLVARLGHHLVSTSAALDRAVLDGYGWSDVAVPPCCPQNDEERAQVAAFEDDKKGAGGSATKGAAEDGRLATEVAASDVDAVNGSVKGRGRGRQAKDSGEAAKGAAKKSRGNKGEPGGQGSLF